jgi:hypothetical protein
LAPQKVAEKQTKMPLTVEAAESIFAVQDNDEEAGVLVFNTAIDVLQDLKPKHIMAWEALSETLKSFEPRGGTDLGSALSAAIAMFGHSPNHDRNKRIVFLRDASPTTGDNLESI